LLIKGGDFIKGEVIDPQRLDRDVERAGCPQARRVAASRRLVVPHIPQPAQHDRGRERLGTGGEAVAKLAQHADQRLTVQRVDLVEEQYERQRALYRPVLQCLEDLRARGRIGPRVRWHEPWLETLPARRPADGGQDLRAGGAIVVPGGLGSLAREPKSDVAPL